MRWKTMLALSLLAVGCVDDDDDTPPPDDDDTPPTTTRVQGHLFDEDTGADLADCEVGVSRSQAVRSGADGRFSLDVARNAAFSVRCEGGLVRSFQLPDVDAVDWEINVDFPGVVPPSDDCVLNVEADLSGLRLSAGDGSVEIRVLGSDGKARSFTTEARETVTFLGFLTAPPGPFRVLARAFGGSVSGFVSSDVIECPGEASEVNVETLVVGFGTTQERAGTWSDAGEGPTVEVYGPWRDADATELAGVEVRLDHTATPTADGFDVVVLDGITDPELRLRACRRGLAGAACVHRGGIAPNGTIAVGALPQHAIVGARLGSGRLEVFTDRELVDGAITALLIDTTDPFNPLPIWKGWSPTGALDISTEWLGTVPPPELLSFIPSGQERVEFTFATDFSPSAEPDGWVELRPTRSDVASGD